MPNYRRCYVPGGTYFFTVNLLRRQHNSLLVEHVQALRDAVLNVRARYPFNIHAWVVLPDHMHFIWELPANDVNFSLRIGLIKASFSKQIMVRTQRSNSRVKRGEREIWQRRFWEHVIRDENDWRRHMDYVHINPLKHGLVQRVCDWPYSSFHRLVRDGIYDINWGGDVDIKIDLGRFE